ISDCRARWLTIRPTAEHAPRALASITDWIDISVLVPRVANLVNQLVHFRSLLELIPQPFVCLDMAATAPAGLLHTVNYVLFDYWEEAWDPRSRHISFVSGGPWKMMAAMAFYVYFSARLGPALMKNRAPFELRGAMLFYNISTVMMNAYFFAMSVYYL